MLINNLIIYLISASFRMASPLLLGSLGELYMEKSGVINVGIEGFMLIGALAGSMGSYYFNNAWLGAITAMVICGILGVIYSFLVVTLRMNQVAVGIAINIFSLGITGFIYRLFVKGMSSLPNVPSFKNISLPLFSKIPILGNSLFNQPILVYLTLFLIPLSHYFFYKTPMGLKVRAVGENPRVADVAGVNVFSIRYIMIIMGSMLMGLGGAYLSLGLINYFCENMVAGRGFISLAIVIIGKYTPWGVLGGALFFAFADALHMCLEVFYPHVPYQFLLMLPYILTIGVLISAVGKSISPAANGLPYLKE